MPGQQAMPYCVVCILLDPCHPLDPYHPPPFWHRTGDCKCGDGVPGNAAGLTYNLLSDFVFQGLEHDAAFKQVASTTLSLSSSHNWGAFLPLLSPTTPPTHLSPCFGICYVTVSLAGINRTWLCKQVMTPRSLSEQPRFPPQG